MCFVVALKNRSPPLGIKNLLRAKSLLNGDKKFNLIEC